MNYELAKKLKDAGFPYEWCTCIDPSDHHIDKKPTLSELIEACEVEGEWFRLHKYPNNGNISWLATTGGKFEGFDTLVASSDPYEAAQRRGKGPTPESAVANLWLALQKP